MHAGDAYESECELIAALGRWDDAPERLRVMREHEAAAETPSVLAFADRLEGRAAAARGDAEAAIPLFERAGVRFGEMGAVWERAITELELAGALAAVGRGSDAAAAAATRRRPSSGSAAAGPGPSSCVWPARGPEPDRGHRRDARGRAPQTSRATPSANSQIDHAT